MNILVTGSYGRVGTTIIDHLHDRDEYEFTYLNRSDRPDDHPYGGFDTVVADIADYNAIRRAFDGQDAVISSWVMTAACCCWTWCSCSARDEPPWLDDGLAGLRSLRP